MNTKFFITIFALVFSCASMAKFQCRQQMNECREKVRSGNLSLPEQRRAMKDCRKQRYACNHNEQNLSCREIYQKRADENERRRERVQKAGGIMAAGSLATAGALFAVAAFTVNPAPAITGAAFVGIAGVGGIIYSLGTIASNEEWMIYFSGGDTPTNMEGRPLLAQELRRASRMINKTGLGYHYHELFPELQRYFSQSMDNGKFCDKYPRLYTLAQAARSMDEAVRQGGFDFHIARPEEERRPSARDQEILDFYNEWKSIRNEDSLVQQQ